MQIKDEAKWSMLQQDLATHGETGRQFMTYLVFWLEAAERIMEEEPDTDAHAALNSAMVITEKEVGEIDGSYLGSMLLYIVGLWAHGEDVFSRLTSIESKMLHTAAMEQIAQLQASAEHEN